MKSLVVTSVNAPNHAMRELAAGAKDHGYVFYLIGDAHTPPGFSLEDCEYYSLDRQAATGFRIAQLLPEHNYARKNVGYLLAIQAGAQTIQETDDDNLPRAGFWEDRPRRFHVPVLSQSGWANIYSYFTDGPVWPRGLALEAIRQPLPAFDTLPRVEADCPIQQGLTDEYPDVDAVYRLALGQPVIFRRDRRIALDRGCWCPFNSQNTTWHEAAFPLLYLPSYCSFRMTDIWRGLIAQRIGWENGWRLLFREADVSHERNEHDLLRDFQDEIPGYLGNAKIAETLAGLRLAQGLENLPGNLMRCYEALVFIGAADRREIPLVEAWLEDLREVGTVAQDPKMPNSL
jgi:hypothetical protein